MFFDEIEKAARLMHEGSWINRRKGAPIEDCYDEDSDGFAPHPAELPEPFSWTLVDMDRRKRRQSRKVRSE